MRVLDQVEVEGHLGPLHRLQDAHDVEVGAEAGEARARTWPAPRRWARCPPAVLCPWPSSRATAGLASRSIADRGRDDEGQHGPQPSGEPGQEGGALSGGPALRQVGRHHRHDGDGDDPVGHLQEGVGVGVGGDRVRAPGGAGEEDDHELGDLIGQHEAERPSAEADHGAQGGVVEVPVPAQPARAPPRAGWAPAPRTGAPRRVRCPVRAARPGCGGPPGWPGWRCRPAKRPNQTRTPMQTRLLTMGAQATATKRRCVLRSAVASAKKP